ncbi:HlyD family secretion protein [Aliiruegeria sabulilitoris]|uniref:HlyD family secretion protein n=1 Tax=Aliiruegeria sabulilitoris TaxID=1510458 RepID=UPI00082F2ED3|nr:biotin/lipoyl-binding protein [Aliiruegeria sabulilitoris]NDR57916.1 biotin/lipoyl-binding protein [Pseudoruegeria sp. M32A2M]
MLFVLGAYAIIVWLVFFQLKVIPWNTLTKVLVGLVGLAILLVFMSLLNTRVPSGRFTVVAPVTGAAPVLSGTVKEVAVETGQFVEDGQLLFSLDERPFRFSLEQAEASLRVAERSFQRIEIAIEKNPATFSQQQLDEARAGYEAASAAVETAKYNLDRTEIRSIEPGTVSWVEIQPGDRVSAFTPVIPVVRNDSQIILGIFDLNGVPAIREGARVGIAPRHQPGVVYWSTVGRIQSASANAQLEGGSLVRTQDVAGESFFMVEIRWPDTLGSDVAPGLIGSAMVIGDNAGAIAGLGELLLSIKALANYL